MANTNTHTATLDAALPQTRVFVRHCDPYGTGEGLGSHARGTLYPLLRVALSFGWTVVWAPPPGLGLANHRAEYVQELQHLGTWLGLDEYDEYMVAVKDNDNSDDGKERIPFHEISIDLEHDARLGRILGYASILIQSIEQFCREHGTETFYYDTATKLQQEAPQRQDLGDCTPTNILVTLHGRFQYQVRCRLVTQQLYHAYLLLRTT